MGAGKRRLKITDFLLQWGRPRRQTAEEQHALLSALSRKDRA